MYTKVDIAIDFLLEELADGERPTACVLEKIDSIGVGKRTFERAREILGVKARQTNRSGWYISIPDIAKKIEERAEIRARAKNGASAAYRNTPKYYGEQNREVSSDWIGVSVRQGNAPKIDVPMRAKSAGGLRVAFGGYEFNADENFPTDKLIEVLRGLGNAGGSGGEPQC